MKWSAYDVWIVGKERPDLETPAARAQDAVSPKSLLALDSKGCPLRLSNPTAEKARTGSGKYDSVIARDLVKGWRGHRDFVPWRFSDACRGSGRMVL